MGCRERLFFMIDFHSKEPFQSWNWGQYQLRLLVLKVFYFWVDFYGHFL
jgi:hypothetical protein